MDKRDLMIVQDFKRRVQEKIPDVKVMLYGSRARHDAQPDSDYDLFVEVEKNNREIEDYIDSCAWEVGFASDFAILIPIVMDKEALSGTLRISPFIHNVFKEGIAV